MTVSADGVELNKDLNVLSMDRSTAYRLALNIITTLAFTESIIEDKDPEDQKDERPVWPS